MNINGAVYNGIISGNFALTSDLSLSGPIGPRGDTGEQGPVGCIGASGMEEVMITYGGFSFPVFMELSELSGLPADGVLTKEDIDFLKAVHPIGYERVFAAWKNKYLENIAKEAFDNVNNINR